MKKKNFIKIPDLILVKSQRIEGRKLLVSTVQNFKHSDILNGSLSHLNIKVEEKDLKFLSEIMPLREAGRFSKKNLEGSITIRRDLPKVDKEIYCGQRPYFGDWDKGSFSLNITRKVFQKDFNPPSEISLSVSLIDTKTVDNDIVYSFKFVVNRLIDVDDSNFQKELLFCLNILQENIGKVDVHSPNATDEDYLKSINLLWDIFPPGVRQDDITKILLGIKILPKDLKEKIEDKYDFLVSLSPQNIITGTSGMRRYFGAKYSDDLVVFENLEYGNAIYVLYENWDELSKLTRTQLLSRNEKDFDRIKHTTLWKDRVAHILKTKLGN